MGLSGNVGISTWGLKGPCGEPAGGGDARRGGGTHLVHRSFGGHQRGDDESILRRTFLAIVYINKELQGTEDKSIPGDLLRTLQPSQGREFDGTIR